jgi:hypothetical protein
MTAPCRYSPLVQAVLVLKVCHHPKIRRLSQNKRQTGVTLFFTAMKTIFGFPFSKLEHPGVILEAV